MQSNINIILI